MTTSLSRYHHNFPSVFEDVHREMDGILKRFFDRDFFGDQDSGSGTWFSPRANVAETENEFEVTLDLPGLKPEEFNVELRQGDLWITGERKYEHEERQKSWHCVERRYGQFRRVIPLGPNVDSDNVSAEYKDGVLTVIVPKTEMARPKRITVKG